MGAESSDDLRALAEAGDSTLIRVRGYVYSRF